MAETLQKDTRCPKCGEKNSFRKTGEALQVYWPGGMNIPAGWITLSYGNEVTLCNPCTATIWVPSFVAEAVPA